MFPSHASMVWAPVDDRDEKLRRQNDYKEYVMGMKSSCRRVDRSFDRLACPPRNRVIKALV